LKEIVPKSGGLADKLDEGVRPTSQKALPHIDALFMTVEAGAVTLKNKL